MNSSNSESTWKEELKEFVVEFLVGFGMLVTFIFLGFLLFGFPFFDGDADEYLAKQGIVQSHTELGLMRNGNREGWWIETYHSRSSKARFRNLSGRHVRNETTSVASAPRPKSIGRYEGGKRQGMWVFWQAPSDNRKAELIVDQVLTGKYERGVKVAPFVPEAFTPFVEGWPWPPVDIIVPKIPLYLRWLDDESKIFEIFERERPEPDFWGVGDEVKLIEQFDTWDAEYGEPWTCLRVDNAGRIRTPKPAQTKGCHDSD